MCFYDRRNTEHWPQKLIMQLIPQQLLVSVCAGKKKTPNNPISLCLIQEMGIKRSQDRGGHGQRLGRAVLGIFIENK